MDEIEKLLTVTLHSLANKPIQLESDKGQEEKKKEKKHKKKKN